MIKDTTIFRESKSHGSRDYPIEYYEHDVPESYCQMQPHWHEEFEITKITLGSLIYRIGQEDHLVQEGDLLIITSDTLHAAHQLDNRRAHTSTIVFHLNLLGLEQMDRCTKKYIEPYTQKKTVPTPVIHPDHPLYQKLLGCLEEIWQYKDPHHGNELLVKAALFRLFYHLWELAPTPSSQVYSPEALRNIERLKPVLTYIHEHYAEPMTIEELASISGFSSVHFMNIFKKVLDTPCMEYILSYRINAASQALKETDAPIMKIALENGFQNIPYFNRSFKAHLGCTPSQYRKYYQK
ncbi:MAG: AraC family transcriptional regulator [Lachnospiraceae bacterium]|nr:AraC family transcriptional regulator [Lachnospiraceae bacterium]